MKDKSVKALLATACVLLLLNLVKGSVAPALIERSASAQIPSVIETGKSYMFDDVSPYYRVITINNDGWAKVAGDNAPGRILWVNLNLIKKVDPKEPLK
jgi:hypothetical protein